MFVDLFWNDPYGFYRLRSAIDLLNPVAHKFTYSMLATTLDYKALRPYTYLVSRTRLF